MRNALIVLALLAPVVSCSAQTTPAKPAAQVPAAAKAAEKAQPSGASTLPGIFEEMRKLREAPDLQATAQALAEYIKQHPEEASGSMASYNVGYALGPQVPKNRQTPDKLRAAISPIEAAFAVALPAAHAQFSDAMASQLFKEGVLLDYAAELETSAIANFTEKGYIEVEKIDHERGQKARAAAGQGPGSPFSEARFRASYPARFCRMISLLGEINLKLGKTDAASEAFNRALKVRTSMEAYRGISAIAEARGDKAAAFDLLCKAFLTGKLPAKDIDKLKQSYAAVKGGDPRAMEAYLDGLYRKDLYHPVKAARYQPPSGRSKKVVLAELFTGAACIPCIPSDSAIDAGLERYSRNELAVLVYHDNAPLADPLSNNAVQERAKYYTTGGSTPHLFLDGKQVRVGEEETPPETAFDRFTKMVDDLLVKPEGAQLKIAASRQGNQVHVTVTGETPKTGESHLQVALVETELSYSGENGLRFQPMVVRATAKQTKTDSGFPLTAPGAINVDYVFDVDAVTKANFAFYDEFDADLKARTQGRVAANYREKKQDINLEHLAVVAFVQDDASKSVLQAAFAAVNSASEPAGK